MSWQADVLTDILDKALTHLSTNPPPPLRGQEETSAGTCWDLAAALDNVVVGMRL